jgi:uncharacterized damage-inducible protein DinB
MDPGLAPLAALFDLHTRLFHNTVDGLSPAAVVARPSEACNSVGFIAAHLVETRAWIGRYLGLKEPPPFGGLLEGAKSIADIPVLPDLATIRAAWDEVGEAVGRRLATIGSDELDQPSKPAFPGVPPTVRGGIAFLVHHEAYHIGQLAYLRKLSGLAPMSYR